MFRMLCAALFLLLLSLAACGGGQGLETQSSGQLGSPAAPDQQVLAELPSPAEALDALKARQSSGYVNRVVEGSDYLMRSLGAQPLPDETAMLLDASAAPRQWAIYGVVVGAAEIDYYGINVSGSASGGSYWVADADYGQNRWKWLGPYSSSTDLPSPYAFGPDGYCFVAVVADKGCTVKIDSLQFAMAGTGVEAILTADPLVGEVPFGAGFSAANSQCFDAPVAKYEWDLDDDGVFELNSGTDPTVEHGYSNPGWYDIRLRVTDELGQSDEAVILLKAQLSGTVPPTAALEILPAFIETGEQCLLDGSNSTDIDGNIVLYSWDLDGDGVFEYDSGTQSFINHAFDDAGPVTVSLRVVDDGGMSDEVGVEIDVHGWQKVVVDAGENMGLGLSLANINGGPGIAYYDYDGGALMYAISSSSEGLDAADWSHFAIDGQGAAEVGKMPSLAVIDGRPAVSYFDETEGALRYARSSTSLGGNPASWSSIELDNSDFCGQGSSLDIIAGNPAVSYYGGNLGLRYARCKNPQGSGDASSWDFVSVSGGSLDGLYTSLEEIGGKPAIAFMDKPFDDLAYARSSDSTGLSADKWSIVTVDEDSENGKYPNLVNCGGTPGIVYYNSGANQLRFARSGSVVGSNWPTKLLLDDGDTGSGAGCSMELVGGKPAAVYLELGSHVLKYIRSTTTTGENLGFWQDEDIDISGDANSYCSICEINGKPAMAYHRSGMGLVYSMQY